MKKTAWFASTAIIALAALAALIAFPADAQADVYNLKIVTDANPDYTDIGSMIHSTTSKWDKDADKMWAIFYWNHIARRQTSPQSLHGMALTDPIRQFNDYGYTMCSTISGNNMAIWGAMGYKARYWDISLHTVCEVFYDDAWHMYDSSLSAIYTRCDGKTIAAVDEIGADGACEASGGKSEAGHVAKYHCLNSTSKNGFLTGCDTIRSTAEEYRCFNPSGLKYRYYFNDWDLGHRYILNVRDNEVYTRHYRRMDTDSPNKVQQGEKGHTADPAYFVPNHGQDPETPNTRYRIRGNGFRNYKPDLAGDLAKAAYRTKNANQVKGGGIEATAAGIIGEADFKVEGANVITSMTINAAFNRKGDEDSSTISISTNNGITWKDVWKNDKTGENAAQVKLLKEVNGYYEVLVKVQVMGKNAPADSQLKSISFDTITQVNSKTQPRLNIGKNTVYVGAGEQTGSIVFWPELQGDRYKPFVVEESNLKTDEKHGGYFGVMKVADDNNPGWLTLCFEAPTDITRVTMGARIYNRNPKGSIEYQYSIDNGQTWTKAWEHKNPASDPVWDLIRYEKIDIPKGNKKVLVKYVLDKFSLYAIRAEANYTPADATFKPMEVTFTWKERQEDYSLVQRSHSQLIEKLPATYEVCVGGVDHPVMESLRVNFKGAAPATQPAKYGYSDDKEIKAEKFQPRWVTLGNIVSEGKPYTVSTQPMSKEKAWGACDPDGKRLTNGIVGGPYNGGLSYSHQVMWNNPVDIVVDLGKAQKVGAFRIQIGGYPGYDALRGQVKDQVEVLVSNDGKEFTPAGKFDFRMRWKDIPANHMWTDEETMYAHNHELVLDKQVEAQFVKFVVKPTRSMGISQVQVLDEIKFAPFDLKLALPDGKDRSDISQYNPKPWKTEAYKRKPANKPAQE